eukprot:s1783_g14.t1
MRLVKGKSGQCGGCWRYWAQCHDSTYVHQPHRRAQAQGYTKEWSNPPWTEEDWTWAGARPSTPRKRTQSPRQRQDKGAKGSTKSKEGKGKGSDSFAMAPPSTQWLSPPALPPSIEPPSISTTATLATSALASMQPFPKPKTDKDEAELHAPRQMHRDLKNKPNLPEDVKKVVASAEVTLRKEDSKSHSKLIQQLNAARKKLSALDEEWEAYRFQWAGYLDKATQMWISHVEAYENGEKKFAEKRKEALQVVQHTRVLLHEAHLRTMEHEGAIGRKEIESAQEALDATMKVEEAEDPATQNNLEQIKAELTGVVKQVKETIEAKLKKRDRSVPSKDAEEDEVEILEHQDKRPREDFT